MGITLPAGVDIIYNKTLRMYDISFFCNIGKNPQFFPRSTFYTLKEITYLFQIAYIWNALSDSVKNDWNLAANVTGQHNYNLFVQDKSYRLKYGIAGNADPSLYHQFTVGRINIADPASSACFAQYNTRKVVFPCSFEMCFKTNLVASGANPSAKLKFTWTRYYQGQNIEVVETIDLSLVSGWDKKKKWVTPQSGIRGKWRIEIELIDVTGDLWFDNAMVEYSGEIKVNDPYCLDVVKWWKNVNPAEGVTFNTIYPTGGAL